MKRSANSPATLTNTLRHRISRTPFSVARSPNIRSGNYDEAIKDLELNLQKFPQSGTLSNTKSLLAVALATEGSAELMKGDASAKDQRLCISTNARPNYLREIIKKKEDIALINEANFQLGEVLLSQAGFSPESERPALYAEALSAYRSVAPKEQIVTLQQDKIREFPARKAAALRANNPALKKQLDRDNERELKKAVRASGKTRSDRHRTFENRRKSISSKAGTMRRAWFSSTCGLS